MDSSGIGELIAAHSRATEGTGQMKLCALQPKVLDLMQMLALQETFEVFENERQALASYGAQSRPAPLECSRAATSAKSRGSRLRPAR